MEHAENEPHDLYSLYEDDKKSNESYQVIFHDGVQQYNINCEEFTLYIKRISDALQLITAPYELIGCLCHPDLIQPVLMLSVLKNSSAFTFLDPKRVLVSLHNLQKYVTLRTVLAEQKTLEVAKPFFCVCWKTVDCISFMHTSVIVLQCSTNNCIAKECCNQYAKNKGKLQCNKDLAYVIQTSGTTGEPKIVQVPQQCIVPNIKHLHTLYGSNSDDVILLVSPLTFDPSIVDIFLSFISSATLVIVSDSVKMQPKKLAQMILECKVTILQATPSLIQSFGVDLMQNIILNKNTSLRILALGGEKCPSIDKLCLWKGKGNETTIFNLYGLTELSCWASCERVCFNDKLSGHDVPLGKPLLDTKIEVRNENNEIIHDGHGELFIGGQKRWCVINDELWPSGLCTIMRSTGDWVYIAKSGDIFFEGRKDNIIKHNGKKVVLGELGKIIESNQSVAQYSIHFDHKTAKLYIFVVLSNLHAVKDEEIRCVILRNLRKAEPNLPVVEIVFTPFIPMTSHGKSDNKKMLKFAVNSMKRKYEADEELSLCSIQKYLDCLWKEYTGCKSTEGTNNFILNGGNSVSAVQFSLEIEWKFQISLPSLVDKLLNSTFEKICTFIKDYLDNRTIVNFKIKKEKLVFPEDYNTSKLLRNKSNVSYQNSSICLRDTSYFPDFKSLFSKVSSRRGTQLACNCQKCSILESKKESYKQSSQGLIIEEKFKYDLKKCIDATACCCEYSGGSIVAFIGSHSGCFVALDVQTGTAVWEKYLPDRIESSSVLSSCGLFILVGCYDCHLYCLDAQSGDLKWKYRTGAEVKSSPVVSPNEVVYVGSHDQHFYAVNINNGKLIWRTKLSNGSIFSSSYYCCNPHLICVATLDGIIAALNPDSGEVLWKYIHGNPIFSSPIVVNSSIFVGSVDKSMLHFGTDGNLIAAYSTKGPIFSSAQHFTFQGKSHENFENYIVFGSHDCMVYCYSVSGVLQWKFCCSSPVYTTPFIFSKAGNYYVAVGCTKGILYILNALEGSIVYSVNLPGEIFSSPVILNEYLIIGCRDNNIYCFNIHCNTMT